MTMAEKIKNYQRLTHYNENTRKAVVYDYISMSPEWSPIVNRLAAFEDAIERGEILLKEEAEKLKAENAALRERLEKALELPRIERLFNGKVGSYKVVYQDKNNRITSEYYSEEKREAAEARLAELKGEEK